MRILHYSLGFPPYRTGGLTKFCVDLMEEQKKEGNEVALLWPGRIQLTSSKTAIRRDKDVNGIKSFEVINPAPVPYDEGINDVVSFMKDGDKGAYIGFLECFRPDVIHIHTFMGLNRNFLLAAKEKGIMLVFTTHDFFPICPRVTLYRNGSVCEDINCIHCPECNVTALSLKKMQLLQSPLYRDLKDSRLVKKLRKHHRDEYLGDSVSVSLKNELKAKSDEYINLRDFYRSMFDLMDFVHYNSLISKTVYEEYFGSHNGQVISITHCDIQDKRIDKQFGPFIRMAYLGPRSVAKGYFRLKKVLGKLWEKRQDFELNVFFHDNEQSPFIKQSNRYSYGQLEDIMKNTDVVITPSILYETFGYTVLEALSYGVPVIVSNHVGAKDIIPTGGGITFRNEEDLFETLLHISPESLKQMNNAILDYAKIKNESEMCSEIMRYGYQK